MSNYSFKKATFLYSTLTPYSFSALFPHLKNYQEIALVGRSNSGKSSLINHFFNQKNLAKASSTPGKTKTLNYFNVDDQLLFVDLPGYGYATAPKEEQKQWSHAVNEYMTHSPRLKLILLLIDSRRAPNDNDIAFARWAKHYQKSLLLIFTKSDTLPSSATENLFKQSATLLLINDYLSYSIKEARYRKMLMFTLNQLLQTLT